MGTLINLFVFIIRPYGLNAILVFILSYQNLEVGLFAKIETPNLVQRGMHIRNAILVFILSLYL